jgi:predicted MPP superfamily phosphohydrolase
MAPPHARLNLLALFCCACDNDLANEEGNLSAADTGSIVTDLAPREAPDTELVARCGDGAAEPAALRLRQPFVQQVIARGALLVVHPPAGTPVNATVTTLDATGVTESVGEADPTVPDGSQELTRLTDLEPATSYCYAIGGISKPAGFRTAPEAGTGAKISFAAFGDSGSGRPDQRALFEQLQTVPLDFIVHTGDLAYDAGTPDEIEHNVFDVYAPLLRSFALYPIVGNHDYATDRATPFLQAFVLPENGSAAQAERWYSFDWADVHFVGLDTEQIGEEQAAWLDADLQSNQLPWTIVFAHRPPYSSGQHGGEPAFRDHFVPVLERYRVPLVLSGHDHDYERTNVLNGVTYVVTGGGGRGTRNVGHSSFTAFSQEVIHFVFIEVQGPRLVLHAIDATGREFDQAVIELGVR